uniref:Uncharacterized protein n=1 Tax=Anguilla anguilla TaxID=7936 RepID=A0A0E9RLK5_ANGAN
MTPLKSCAPSQRHRENHLPKHSYQVWLFPHGLPL